MKGGFIIFEKIKKYILGILTSLMLVLIGVDNLNYYNDIVVNAEESSDMVYIGTPINPTGTYDKIYFNTNLSVEEVDAMLSQLEYMKYDDFDAYGILVNSAFTRGILVMKGAFGDSPFYVIAYQNQELNEMITLYSSASTGWQDESYSVFEFGLITGINDLDGTPIGQQNYFLSSLISSTPFEYVPITDTEWKGTPINPTGTYDKIYFNTSLSYDEVINILESISYSDTSQGIAGYVIIAWNDEIEGDISLVIGDFGQAFGLSRNLVIGYLDTFIFAENAFPQIGINTAGWQEFDNPLELSITGILDEGNPDGIGLQNDKISTLVSSTPYYRVLKPVDNTNNNKDIVNDIFETGKEALIGVEGLLTDGVQALVSVFYINNELTIVGTALAIGAGVGVLYFLFRFIKNWFFKLKGE